MKRSIYLTAMAVFALIGVAFTSGCSLSKQVEEEVQDSRGKMKPWEAGAWETGKYRALKRELPHHHS